MTMPPSTKLDLPNSIKVISVSGAEIMPRTDGLGVSPSTDTAADLHRYFCEPYCPRCGFVDEARKEGAPCPTCSAHLKPGLHTRDPRTKVEGLEILPWRQEMVPRGQPQFNLRMRGHPHAALIEPAHAADLLTAGIIKGVVATEGLDGFERFLKLWVEEIRSRELAPGSPEAAALAYHRMLDQQETTNGSSPH